MTTKTAPPAAVALAAEVMAYAVAHYTDGGWDMVVECWTIEDLAKSLAEDGVTTLEQAVTLSTIAACVDVWADRQADAQFHATESYCGFQGEHAWCYFPPKHDGDAHSDGTPVRTRTPDGYPR